MGAIPTSEDLVSLFENGMLAGEMARRFRLNDPAEIQVVEARCAALHNAGTIDLLRLIEDAALQQLALSPFFRATHFFCQILPELEAPPARMMACVEALVTRGGEDGAANWPNAAFRTWCSKDPRRAHEIIAAARGGEELASRHLAFALEAINDITEARQIALAYDDVRRRAAIAALGRVTDDDPGSRAETLAVFGAILQRGIDDTVRGTLLHATAAILDRSGDEPSPEAVALVQRLVEDAGESTVHQAAQMLWAYRKALQPDIVASLLEALAHLNPANKGTVEELDLGLQALLENGHDEAAIAYVTKLLARPDVSLALEELDNFSETLLSGPPDRLSRVVVQWLLLGAPRLCEGLADAMQGHGLDGPPLSLRAEDLAIPSTAQVFLCRKAIGWFFSKPTTAASVLVSVLRVCDAETTLEVQKLLVERLLTNYSGVRKYLEGLAPDDPAKEHVDKALAQNDAYLKALREIPLIKELQPSEHHRRIEWLRMLDRMRDVQKQAQRESVFYNLANHMVLLYGKRLLSLVKGDKDELHPMEMDLKQYGVSFEMSRMEIVDPVGLDYILRIFRAERMAP